MRCFRGFTFFVMICLSTSLMSAPKKSSEIVIELKAPSPLLPVYLDSTRVDSTVISHELARQLEEILLFDLNNNGKTRTLSSSEVPEYKKGRSSAEWQKLGVHYVITPSIKENYLTFSVLSSKEDKICYAEDCKLTGNISLDRTKIHQFMQRLHEKLFNEEGIYLNKILYTFKARNASDAYYASVVEEIYQCDWDGGNPKRLTFENSHCITPHPVLSKDGKSFDGFFYVSYKLGQPKIYWTKFGEKTPQRLSYIPGNQFMPCLSKNGDKVAFINDALGNPEVFLQDFRPGIGAVGKPRQISSNKRGVQASPVFSPDGRKIAFVSDKDGYPRIYVMDIPAAQSNVKDLKPYLITKLSQENTKPTWSPDGSKLAYVSKVDGIRQIWIYDFTTQQEWQLTYGDTNKENPQWAFNSLHLSFNSVANESSELYIVNLNQPKAIRIKVEPGIKRFPAWLKQN